VWRSLNTRAASFGIEGLRNDSLSLPVKKFTATSRYTKPNFTLKNKDDFSTEMLYISACSYHISYLELRILRLAGVLKK